METTRLHLVSCDGQVFEVERTAVYRSRTIMKMLQVMANSNQDSPVVLDGIDGETLKKVIEFCNRHDVPYSDLSDDAVVKSLHAFDADFVNVDKTTFFNLVQASYYLKIESLFDLTCGTLSKKFKGKNYKEIGEVIKNWKQNADQKT